MTLGLSIAVTVLVVERQPALLWLTTPMMIAAFFGVLQSLMLAMSRIGLPQPLVHAVPVPVAELRGRLLALSAADSPFQVSE